MNSIFGLVEYLAIECQIGYEYARRIWRWILGYFFFGIAIVLMLIYIGAYHPKGSLAVAYWIAAFYELAAFVVAIHPGFLLGILGIGTAGAALNPTKWNENFPKIVEAIRQTILVFQGYLIGIPLVATLVADPATNPGLALTLPAVGFVVGMIFVAAGATGKFALHTAGAIGTGFLVGALAEMARFPFELPYRVIGAAIAIITLSALEESVKTAALGLWKHIFSRKGIASIILAAFLLWLFVPQAFHSLVKTMEESHQKAGESTSFLEKIIKKGGGDGDGWTTHRNISCKIEGLWSERNQGFCQLGMFEPGTYRFVPDYRDWALFTESNSNFYLIPLEGKPLSVWGGTSQGRVFQEQFRALAWVKNDLFGRPVIETGNDVFIDGLAPEFILTKRTSLGIGINQIPGETIKGSKGIISGKIQRKD